MSSGFSGSFMLMLILFLAGGTVEVSYIAIISEMNEDCSFLGCDAM